MGLLGLALVAALPAASAADIAPPGPAQEVEAIIVNGAKLPVVTLIDRKVYDITADVQATFGSLSDVLTAIPSVDVDPDGVVSLRGDSNVLILIDGKPSTRLSGSAAGDNLQSIAAKDIERIEIITTPPAQFKADGAAGVINIITRKQHPQGLAGTVQGSIGSGGRAIAGGNASFSAGALTVAATVGFRHDYRARRIASDVHAPDPVSGQLLDSRSVLDERVHRQVPSAEISSEYAMSESRSLSGSLSWGERGGLRTYTQMNTAGTAAGAVTDAARRLSSGHDPERDYDGELAYSQKLGRDGEKLDLSLHRGTSRQREHYDYTNDALFPPAATYFSSLGMNEDRATSEFAADYALPLSKAQALKLGYAFEQDDFHFGNLAVNVDPSTGVPVVDRAIPTTSAFASRSTPVTRATRAAWAPGTGSRASGPR